VISQPGLNRAAQANSVFISFFIGTTRNADTHRNLVSADGSSCDICDTSLVLLILIVIDIAASISYRTQPMKNSRADFLPGFQKVGRKEFGGANLKGNPRAARPIAIKRPMHLVLRSSYAKGRKSFLHTDRADRIRSVVFRLGKAKGVKIYRFANSGNHLHLLLQARSRTAFHGFLRAITGIIARITLQVQRGYPMGLKFWDHSRPFSRIVEWGREFNSVANYLLQNTLEGLRLTAYRPRVRKANL
jgi:REP element-mobilizing transposase RayT